MRYLLSFTCLVCLLGTVFADPPATIIPRPVAVEWLPGMFVLGPGTKISTAQDAVASGKYLADLLGGATGYTVAVEPAESLQASSGLIMLTTSDAKESLGSEGYELEVRPEGIALRARGPAGFFYGVQTIRQLLPPEIESRQPVAGRTWTIPAVRIEDQPRFRWRGLMLDCTRTFLTTEYLRRYIDLLALYKMNVLHLHLTDDEGWRMEVKRHPELTLHGSKFAKRYPNPEGYYTQDDLRELVAYAASRQILIVPEIEMPGHSLALLATYPDLSCGGGPFEIHPYPYEVYGSGPVLCAGNERTFTVLEDVLAEVIETFPSPYIHIGGDEVSKGPWQGCPKCQARMKNEALKNYDELQSYFIKRIERFVRSKNRTLLGWDEILEGGLPESAVVMSWRGSQGGIQAARMGHDVVMSPTSHCYFDYTYWQIPTELVYSYDPIPKELTRSANAARARRPGQHVDPHRDHRVVHRPADSAPADCPVRGGLVAERRAQSGRVRAAIGVAFPASGSARPEVQHEEAVYADDPKARLGLAGSACEQFWHLEGLPSRVRLRRRPGDVLLERPGNPCR